MRLRLLTWNIQQLGRLKGGLGVPPNAPNLMDILGAVARVLRDQQVDIACIQEINTTDEATARTICTNLLARLHALGGADRWYCVISPNARLEFYAFFIRNQDKVVPVPIIGRMQGNPPVFAANPPSTVGVDEGGTPLDRAVFGRVALPAGGGVLPARFPLYTPDVPWPTSPNLNPPAWGTHYRKPVLGIFELVGAAQATNRYLAIHACHYDPHPVMAATQLGRLPYYSVLAGVGPGPAAGFNPRAPAQLLVSTAAAPAAPVLTPINMVAMTGDFNINFVGDARKYRPLMNAYPGLGALVTNAVPATSPDFESTYTIMVTPRVYRENRDHRAFTSMCIDNFFVRGSTAYGGNFAYNGGNRSIVTAESRVVNILGLIRDKTLRLNESIQHYAHLDQKGFQGANDIYAAFINNYVNQLQGPGPILIDDAVLVGARLISDHLPVLLCLDIA